jgi:CHAT domain-containing protein
MKDPREVLREAEGLIEADPREAESLAEKVAAHSERQSDLELLAESLRVRSASRIRLASYDAAMEDSRRARRLFEEQGLESKAFGQAFQELAILRRTGKVREALKLAERLTRSRGCRGNPRAASDLYSHLAILRGITEDLDGALRASDRAGELAEQIGDRRRLGFVLINRANLLMETEDFRRAEGSLLEARALFEELGDRARLATVINNLAELEYTRGRYADALELARPARRELSELGFRNEAGQALLSEAQTLDELNLLEEASALAARAVEELKALGASVDATEALWLSGRILTRLGGPEALDLLGRAESGYTRLGMPRAAARVAVDRARALLRTGPLESAREVAQRAGRLLARGPNISDLARARIVEGRALIGLRRPGPAAGLMQRTVKLLEARRIRTPLGEVALVLGDARAAQGRRQEAVRAYEKSAREAESVRSLLRDEASRVACLEDRAEAFDQILAIRLQAKRPNQAAVFRAMERGRARTLLDLVSGDLAGRIVPSTAEGEQMLEQLRRVKEELLWLYGREREREGKGEDSEALRRRITPLEVRASSLLRELGAMAGAEQGPLPIPKLDEISAVLPRDSVLLEYALTDAGCWILQVAREGRRLHRLAASRSEIENLAEAVRWELDSHLRNGIREAAGRAMDEILDELHEHLVRPLDELPPVVIVVPHGPLHSLPMGALFPEGCAVSVAPSASLLTALSGRPVGGTDPPLVMGFASEHSPGAEEEVREVSGHLRRARAVTGEGASIATIREWGREPGVLHLAGHLERSENPSFTSLVLADGGLTPIDIRSLEIRTPLVFLSACSTARGRLAPGEEMQAFYRAFLGAGARSLVVTHWPLRDETARAFAGAFYRALEGGSPPAQALALARIEARRNLSSPFDWAAHELLGPGHLPA